MLILLRCFVRLLLFTVIVDIVIHLIKRESIKLDQFGDYVRNIVLVLVVESIFGMLGQSLLLLVMLNCFFSIILILTLCF